MAYSNRALANVALANYESAIFDCDTSISLSPAAPHAYIARSFAHIAQGHYESALIDCNQAIHLKPMVPEALGVRGLAHFLLEQYEKATTDFQRALELQPDLDFALAGQAFAYYATGRTQDAKRVWGNLVKINTNYNDPDCVNDEFLRIEVLAATARKIIEITTE